MIQIGSKLNVIDNSGIKVVRCININSNKKTADIGNFILVTLHKYINILKSKKRVFYLGLIINVKFWVLRIDGIVLKYFCNNILIFNKNFKLLGSRVLGIISKEIKFKIYKNKQYFKIFQKVISYSSFIV